MALLIIGLILFIGLILVHEWGHFIAAKRNGVKVEEYGIFFPPRLWHKKMKGGWDFSINLLPIGGFVRLKGESDADLRKGTFGGAPLKTKVKIMLAGVIMNLVVAFGLLAFLAFVGMPQLVDKQFTIKADEHIAKHEVLAGYVEPDSPAAKAGLAVRDQIVGFEVAGKTVAVSTAEVLPEVTKKLAGQTATLVYIHDGSTVKKTVTLRSSSEIAASQKTDSPKGALGVSPTEYSMKRYTWSAPVVAAGTMAQFTGLTFKGLGTALASLFTGNTTKASEQVSGPVGIFAVMKSGAFLGYQFMLLIVALISLSLAIMNVLPIPALDGGKLFVTLVARLVKRRLTERLEAWLYGGSFALLIGLLILITVVDVKRFF